MSENTQQTHATTIKPAKPIPASIDAGIEFELPVSVTCPHGCDLTGYQIRLVDESGTLAGEAQLTRTDERTFLASCRVQAPVEPGKYSWRIEFPEQEKQGLVHAASSLQANFTVKPHAASVSVWDVPMPAKMNQPFEITVGVKCSAGCNLGGAPVLVLDKSGKVLAEGTLGNDPLPNTDAVYWTGLVLRAPDVEDTHAWTVKFPGSGLELPHDQTSTVFNFRTVAPPEHVITVRVTNSDYKMPVDGADVLVNSFRAHTDENGIARVESPKGTQELCVAKVNFEMYKTNVEVNSDVTVDVELVPYHY